MVWVIAKKVFYHILDLGIESIGIPVRVKFEFEVRNGRFVPGSLCSRQLYNLKPLARRFPDLKSQRLKRDINRTVEQAIFKYLEDCGYIEATGRQAPSRDKSLRSPA